LENNSLRPLLTRPEGSHRFDLVVAVVVIVALYFARVVFIPLALALLFSLLLTPPVTFLEKIRLPRIVAIFLVVLLLVGLMGLLGWKTSQQLGDLTDRLPTYKETIRGKIRALKSSGGQSFNKASDTMKELGKEIVTSTPGLTPPKEEKKMSEARGASASRPLAVEVVPQNNPLESVQDLLGPMATAGMVVIFTIFMLIGREDLRNRFIRLAGGGQLNAMTQALDEATHRINRYLFLQLVVNSGYGVIIGAALHFIGIPNAWLWGVCAAILRFLPYVGPPLAAVMPIVLSLAVFPGWHHALLTAGLFLSLEVIASNVVEPFVYGAHVGLSALAILVAAIFWTLIWGFPGLVLSTPLTVCLVVLGRYVPQLGFLNVLLGDEPVLPPHAQYYQRLLAADQDEARQILEEYLKKKPLEDLYSSVVIPALSLAEQDRHRNELDEERQKFIYQSTRELIEELSDTSEDQEKEGFGERAPAGSGGDGELPGTLEILCIPARDEADEIVGILLARALERQGHRAQSIPIATTGEMLLQVAELKPKVVCISALPPFALDHARALYAKMRAQFSDTHLVVCLWHFEGNLQKATIRMKLTRGDGFFTTLQAILDHLDYRGKSIPLEVKQL
jgi:predicted PurR-regulated permease PerM